MNEGQHINWQIILDKLNNTISNKDLKTFNEWLSSDSKNQFLFENIRSLKANETYFKKLDNIDLEKAWRKVEKTIQPVNKSKTIFLSILKYAAVFILGMLTIYNWNFISNTPDIVQPLAYHTVLVPNGSKAEVKLADGTEVTLNGGSQLTYPEQFIDAKREVTLAGEAYFDVERDETRPFFIQTADIKIRVLGTSFNVKAYPEDNAVETFVTSGKVEIELATKYEQDQKVFLSSNEKAVFIKSGIQIHKEGTGELTENQSREEKQKINNEYDKPQLLITEQKNSEEEIAWRQDKFIFKNEPMEDLIKKLKRWYGVEIELNKEGLKKYHFTGTFEQETIEQVMNAMAYSIPIEWKKDRKKILISIKK